ncbi:MAG TPA: cell division protein ZapA [Terriglobia bacterium]|jgi:cell division protein ZapA (FtsZ GTPase activity inhibitor)
MAGKADSVQVKIYDQSYQLRSDSGDDYTRHLAKSVDATMRTIAEKTRTYDSLRLAVLAALHFADECERLRNHHDQLQEAVREKTQRLSEALDGALKKGA